MQSLAFKNKKKKISHRHCIGPLHGSSSPFNALSRRGLNPIKPVYDADWPDGRFNLTASTFNQLGQYTSSPGRRGYCYAELAVFFPSGGRSHRQYSLRLPTEGWSGWVGLGGWLRSETVYLPEGSHPFQFSQAQCRATALIETNTLLLHQKATPI